MKLETETTFFILALTDTYATIYHFVNKAKDTFYTTKNFTQKELSNPRTVNITILKSKW